MKKLLFTILFLLIAAPVSAKMLWEYGSFDERAEMAVDNGIVANTSEYQGTYEQNISLLSVIENNGKIEHLGASTQPAALTTYNLAGSGVSSSATSITLQSLTIPQNDYLIQDADLSDTFYLTLEPGNKVRQEITSCTTVTQNTGGTATLSGCTRGLSPITPYTASSTLQFSHAGGSQVIFSDPPQLFNLYPAKANSETIAGDWGYTIIPSSTDECTETDEFCTKTYIDNSVSQGAATSTESVAGICELATQIEMASSTDLGTDSPLCLQAKNATTTPDVRGLYIPVADNDGYLNQQWLDLSQDFNLTGSSTQASTTATNLYTNNLYLNGNDTDNLVGGNNADSLHIHNYSNLQVSTTTNYTAGVSQVPLTASTTIAANALGTNGVIRAKINISSLGTFNNAATRTFTVRYGSSGGVSVVITNSSGGSITLKGYILAEVTAADSTSAQEVFITAHFGNGVVTDAAVDALNVLGSENDTIAVDSTQDQPFVILGQGSEASAITSVNGYVEILK